MIIISETLKGGLGDKETGGQGDGETRGRGDVWGSGRGFLISDVGLRRNLRICPPAGG